MRVTSRWPATGYRVGMKGMMKASSTMGHGALRLVTAVAPTQLLPDPVEPIQALIVSTIVTQKPPNATAMSAASDPVAPPPGASVARCDTQCYRVDMSDHFTLRFRPGTTSRLQRRAQRAGTAPRTLAQRYVEEGLRHDDHPLIHFVEGPSGRRAALVGTGLDVWEVIATVRDNDNDVASTAEYLRTPVGLVEAAVSYYGEYRAEIDDEISLNEDEYERGYGAFEAGRRALDT